MPLCHLIASIICNSHLEHERACELVENSVRVVVRGGGHIAQSLPCTGSQHHGTSATGAITKYPCYLPIWMGRHKRQKEVIFKAVMILSITPGTPVKCKKMLLTVILFLLEDQASYIYLPEQTRNIL